MTTTIPKNIRQEFEKKIRRGIFQPIARHLPEDIREDRLQDAIAQVWEMYERYAERGELLDDAILVHACRLRATDPGRHYVPCEGYQRKRDVLDPRNYMQGNLEVLHLDDVADDMEDTSFSLGFAELDSTNPTRRIISAISLNEWLETLTPRDRELIELRAAGYDLDESAEKLGLTRFAVCRRVKELGELLAQHAGMPDAVHRRQLKHAKASEEPAPESGIREKVTRGRPKKSVASPAWHKPSRRVRRAA
ncbi:hypothetical protein KEG38_20560 [Polyangium jinanense]|uniref:hypothetical protein n=1 Tax=Polyangium jinanense TaxID=2829994 RepID=UPI002341DD54|nr:hypothetical protein [Polyangium jinanense]MDC3956265.1 hypothetical protein [Polyangium jinanense]